MLRSICVHNTNNNKTSIPRVPFFCGTFHGGHWLAANYRSCSAAQAATTAFVVATRAAVDRCGPCRVCAPQRAGEEVRVEAHGEVPEEPLPQPELFSLHEEEPGGSRPPVWVSRKGRKSGYSGTPWSSSPTLLPWCRFSMYQRRSRGNSWWKPSSISTPQCPRR